MTMLLRTVPTTKQSLRMDTVLPFQLMNSSVRGRAARMSGLLDDMLGRHEYPPAVNEVVAEAVVLTALIGQLVNLGWKFSLQFRSDGPLRLVAADTSPPSPAARLRGCAHMPAIESRSLRLPAANLSPAAGMGILHS